jgi:UDP-galactopyranose mutase
LRFPRHFENDSNRAVSATTRDNDVTFTGRLGTYRHFDMDVTIAETMTTVDVI